MIRSLAALTAVGLALLATPGCGTTKWSDTPRTATEQLLISSAVDRAVNNIDFTPLADKDVYLDPTYLASVTDKDYLISTLHQHMRAQGCLLKTKQDEATYVVEARAGAIGTNHHDVLVGIPSISVPSMGMPGVPSAIPEIPFAKSTDQKALAKIACFAYNQRTGQPIWQSGVIPVVTNAKDTWILGTGPFQRGSVRDETHFAGARLRFWRRHPEKNLRQPEISVTDKASFPEDTRLAQKSAPAARLPSGSSAPGSAAVGAQPAGGAPSTSQTPGGSPAPAPAGSTPAPSGGVGAQPTPANPTSGISNGTSTTSAAAPTSGTTGFSGVTIGTPPPNAPTSGLSSGQVLRFPAKL